MVFVTVACRCHPGEGLFSSAARGVPAPPLEVLWGGVVPVVRGAPHPKPGRPPPPALRARPGTGPAPPLLWSWDLPYLGSQAPPRRDRKHSDRHI